MYHRTREPKRYFMVSLLWAALCTVGCQEPGQTRQWGSADWNWFGAGTHTKTYDLQYPVGDTQALRPDAVKSSPFEFKNPFKKTTFTKEYQLQYPVGKTQAVKRQPAASRPAPVVHRPTPRATPLRQVAVVPQRSSGGAGTYTKNFNLQYDIGPTQAVNGHTVAPTARKSSYNRSYYLQYPIGAPQPIRHGSPGGSHSVVASAQPISRPAQFAPRSPSVQMMTSNRQTPVSGISGGTTYTVRPGDTMMGIARRYYGPSQASRWQDIMAANRHLIQRPDQIVPGMTLRIP